MEYEHADYFPFDFEWKLLNHQIQCNMIMVTVFFPVMNEMEFHLVKNLEENIIHSIWNKMETYFSDSVLIWLSP